MAGRWVDVGEAAHELGISTDAVRKRIARGSLRSDRPNGSVLVWLDDGGTEAGREAQVDREALLEAKDETIRLLEEQLRLRAEEIQRRDVIISQLTQATSNLTERIRELEAPAAQAEPASEGAAEEARKEVARRLVGGVFGLAIFIPSSITSVISYFNGASTATILFAATALFGIVGGLVGTYFGIKASSDTQERARRIIAEANIAAEQATQEVRQEPRDDG